MTTARLSFPFCSSSRILLNPRQILICPFDSGYRKICWMWEGIWVRPAALNGTSPRAFQSPMLLEANDRTRSLIASWRANAFLSTSAVKLASSPVICNHNAAQDWMLTGSRPAKNNTELSGSSLGIHQSVTLIGDSYLLRCQSHVSSYFRSSPLVCNRCKSLNQLTWALEPSTYCWGAKYLKISSISGHYIVIFCNNTLIVRMSNQCWIYETIVGKCKIAKRLLFPSIGIFLLQDRFEGGQRVFLSISTTILRKFVIANCN